MTFIIMYHFVYKYKIFDLKKKKKFWSLSTRASIDPKINFIFSYYFDIYINICTYDYYHNLSRKFFKNLILSNLIKFFFVYKKILKFVINFI